MQALSPTGKHIPVEAESRQILINKKLEAMEQASMRKMPRYLKDWKMPMSEKRSTTMESSGLSTSLQTASKLTEKSERALLSYGV